MNGTSLLLLAISVFGGVIFWLRMRSQRRIAIVARDVSEWLADNFPALEATTDAGELQMTSRGGTTTTVRLATLATASDAGSSSRQELYGAVASLGSSGIVASAEPFDLKRDGLCVLPLIVPSQLVALLPDRRDIPTQSLPGGRLTALYVRETDGDLRYLTDDQLHAVGIDRRDLRGIGYAVLRQRLEVEETQTQLAATGITQLPARDRFTASRLLVADELIEDGRELFGRALAADQLWIATTPEPLAEETLSRSRSDTADSGEIGLPAQVFRLTAAGLRVDSSD